MRFSLMAFLFFAAFCGVTAAAISNGTSLWLQAYFTMLLLVLLTAVLMSIVGRPDRRAFWIGFCLFGWGYAALAFSPFGNDAHRQQLITTSIQNEVIERLPRAQSRPQPIPTYAKFYPATALSTVPPIPQPLPPPLPAAPTPASPNASAAPPPLPTPYAAPQVSYATVASYPVVNSYPNGPYIERAGDIFHCAWTMIFALLGGALGSWIKRAREQTRIDES